MKSRRAGRGGLLIGAVSNGSDFGRVAPPSGMLVSIASAGVAALSHGTLLGRAGVESDVLAV